MSSYLSILIIGFSLLYLFHEPEKETTMIPMPKPLTTPKYGRGDLVKLIHNGAICLYLNRYVSQEPSFDENGKLKNVEIYIHRVVDLRADCNPIDCMDTDIEPYQTATYTDARKEKPNDPIRRFD